VYHTKLEQLTTLTNRIKALARTLGLDYYSQDILEPSIATGEDTNDLNENLDVTPERFSKLEKELVRGKAEVVSPPSFRPGYAGRCLVNFLLAYHYFCILGQTLKSIISDFCSN